MAAVSAMGAVRDRGSELRGQVEPRHSSRRGQMPKRFPPRGGSRKKSAIQVPIGYDRLSPANRNDVLVVAG
jgi:hypothetical protein